jgi:hypothetical protein
VFECFFGGARGGGKTDAVLGDWAIHSDAYGSGAIGLMVRRSRTELMETFERAREICTKLEAHITYQPMRITMPNGARLTFAYLEQDRDAELYQGASFCVAVGTRIRMANGTLKAIETIQTGEIVATLEGPRRVIDTTKPYLAACVRALVRDASGVALGSQRHPIWHPVLTTSGLSLQRSSLTHGSVARPLPEAAFRGKPASGFARDASQEFPAWLAWKEDGYSDCIASEHAPRDDQRPVVLSVPVVLHAPLPPTSRQHAHDCRVPSTEYRSRGISAEQRQGLSQAIQLAHSDLLPVGGHAQLVQDCDAHFRPNDGSYGRSDFRIAQGLQDDYRSGHGSCDAQSRPGAKTDRDGIPLRGDVASTPRELPSDASDTIPGRSQPDQLWWEHPYTGEARCLVERVTTGTMEVRECGPAWVADLSVEGANHYISETGLVNKNTRVYVEEAGNFPSPGPIMKLMATLRSGTGVPVGLRLTGNPGGPGHQWVRARYIDPAPLGWQVLRDADGLERIYIPSRVGDNIYLGPDYVQRLKASGSPELVRAWLEGDWSVVSGAFFPEFSMERHVIAPRELPAHWARFRSFDWGSARPFSVGWWAVSDGSINSIARGALVRYREWYGMQPNQPNVGLRMTAEAIAAGILTREAGDGHLVGVADPAIFTEDGGPSIAQRMAMAGVIWRAADNKRVSGRGAMGGWDQVRHRLAGDGDGMPMLQMFSTCRDLIRTLPALQHDDARPEDVDTDAEDHAADECRYACMSRPWVRDAVKPKVADSWSRAFERANAEDVEGWRVA